MRWLSVARRAAPERCETTLRGCAAAVDDRGATLQEVLPVSEL